MAARGSNMGMAAFFAAWAFTSGALIPVMASLNAGLGRALGGPQWASVILLGVGCLCAIAAAIAFRAPLPTASGLATASWPQFFGGVIVAFYVLSITYLAPRFGVGNAILFVVAAQIVTAALIDQFGWLGAALAPAGPIRLTGLVVMIIGLVLTQAEGVLKR